jgi:hypothetical protein
MDLKFLGAVFSFQYGSKLISDKDHQLITSRRQAPAKDSESFQVKSSDYFAPTPCNCKTRPPSSVNSPETQNLIYSIFTVIAKPKKYPVPKRAETRLKSRNSRNYLPV